MKQITAIFVLIILSAHLFGQNIEQTEYALKKDISYIKSTEKDEYRKERCKLDIYYPANKKDYPTVVWFHGGGLESGAKDLPDELKEKGIAVISVNYRLSPKAKNPAYIEDAAEAIAWTFQNIESYGGNNSKIYISGHSAGGYLALIVGLDKTYLQKHDIDADKIKGLLPISGQTNTHYTIRKERGLPMNLPIIDEYAPLNKARENCPPTLLITGDRNLEMTARYEENAHLYAILKSFNNKEIALCELQGFDHGSVRGPGCYLVVDWIWKHEK